MHSPVYLQGQCMQAADMHVNSLVRFSTSRLTCSGSPISVRLSMHQITDRTHPKMLSAAAVAKRGSSGAAETKAAARAVTEQPAAVIRVISLCPLSTANVCLPSVTCRNEGHQPRVLPCM